MLLPRGMIININRARRIRLSGEDGLFCIDRQDLDIGRDSVFLKGKERMKQGRPQTEEMHHGIEKHLNPVQGMDSRDFATVEFTPWVS